MKYLYRQLGLLTGRYGTASSGTPMRRASRRCVLGHRDRREYFSRAGVTPSIVIGLHVGDMESMSMSSRRWITVWDEDRLNFYGRE